MGTGHHQFIVRLIDGADMSLSPGKHGHTGRVLTTMPGLWETILIFTQLDNTRITALGSPPVRDTVVSNNDAANIVQELFVCAAFRTNKSFGRSLSPSEELFESMNYILRLL